MLGKNIKIVNPFTPIPVSDKSHTHGWAMLWKQKLEKYDHVNPSKGYLRGRDVDSRAEKPTINDVEIIHKEFDLHPSETDVICFDHGVNNPEGKLNLFGGFGDEVYERTKRLISAVNREIPLLSLDFDMPDYSTMIESRLGAKSTAEALDFDFTLDLYETLIRAKTMKMGHLDLNDAIIGDSHSLAFSLREQAILHRNGQTLFGALSTGRDKRTGERKGPVGLIDYLLNNNVMKYDKVTLSLGSIDLRFHTANVEKAVFLAERYAKAVNIAMDELGIEISVCAPVPVEYEGRRIPKTGMYKGEPFNGSCSLRQETTDAFINTLDNYFLDFDLIIPPHKWYKMDPEEYAKEIMESASSVHIAPSNYRSIRGW